MPDINEINPTWQRVLRYFAYDHLPVELQAYSRPMCDLALLMVESLHNTTDPAEVTVGLRKLLEAKDCFVRARLP